MDVLLDKIPPFYYNVSLMSFTTRLFPALLLVILFGSVITPLHVQALTDLPAPLSPSYEQTMQVTLPPAQSIPAPIPTPTAFPSSSYPTNLSIPSINLSANVEIVGQESNGEMAVPSGKGSNVGWFKNGTIPGNRGSAVLDAHVFAAFSNLKDLQIGSDVYVTNAQNQTLHFVVSDMKTYALGALSPQTLFYQTDGRRLNLITCAGKLTPDHSTYDHRLVVFTTFVGIVNS